MLSRIVWGATIGAMIALVWVGYRRGAFERRNMRYGINRVREGLQVVGSQAMNTLNSVRERASRQIHGVSDAEESMEARSSIERVTGV